jgi:hypothetical protein
LQDCTNSKIVGVALYYVGTVAASARSWRLAAAAQTTQIKKPARWLACWYHWLNIANGGKKSSFPLSFRFPRLPFILRIADAAEFTSDFVGRS